MRRLQRLADGAVTPIRHTGATGSGAFHSSEAGLHLAGTFDNPRDVAAPFRIVPALIRAHSAGP